MCKWRMRPVAGRLVPCGVHKALVLRARDRTHAQLELIDEDRMRRPLVLVAELSAMVNQPPAIGAKAEVSIDERGSAIARS